MVQFMKTENDVKIDEKILDDLPKLAQLRLFDDEFMTKFFDGNIECTQFILGILMDMPDIQVTDVKTQYFMQNLLKR